ERCRTLPDDRGSDERCRTLPDGRGSDDAAERSLTVAARTTLPNAAERSLTVAARTNAACRTLPYGRGPAGPSPPESPPSPGPPRVFQKGLRWPASFFALPVLGFPGRLDGYGVSSVSARVVGRRGGAGSSSTTSAAAAGSAPGTVSTALQAGQRTCLPADPSGT